MREKRDGGPLHAALIAGAGLILAAPVLCLGFPQVTDDAQWHSVWYTHFADQLWAGDLYPRWLSGLNGGLGSPVFFFYPPAAYYLTSVCHILVPDDPNGWYQLGISSAVALIASGLTAYLWLGGIVSRKSAAVAAVLYMAAPYHLAVDLYTRGAFAEFWAFVWMPLMLYFAGRLVVGARFAVVGLAVSYALLLMTHLPTAVIFFLVPPAYVALTAEAGRRPRTLLKAAGAASLGVGLAAVYLLPALTTQENVMIARMRTGHFHFSNHFLFAGLKLWGGVTGKMSAMVVAVAGVACCAFALARLGVRDRGREAAFWAAMVALSVFMTTPLSTLVWRALPPLQALQFPWRFNTLLTVATAALTALALPALRKARDLKIAGVLAVCSVLLAGWALATVWAALTAFPETNRTEAARISEQNRQLSVSRDATEYQPVRTSTKTINQELDQLLQGAGGGGRRHRVTVEGDARVTVARWRPRFISLETDAPEGARLVVGQFYYPGWAARLDGGRGGETRLDVQPSVPDGWLSLRVPGGRHTVSLRLEPTWQERAGQTLSVVAALVTALLFVYALRAGRGRAA